MTEKLDFTFLQPDLEHKSDYHKYIIPKDHPLFGIIYDIYELHGARGYKESADIVPSCLSSIEIAYINSPEYVNFRGSFPKYQNVIFDETDSIIIDIYPYMSFNFGYNKAVTSNEVYDCTNDLNKYYSYFKSISSCMTFEEKVHICLNFFTDFVKNNGIYLDVISTITHHTLNHKEKFSINQLAQKTNYSPRQLQRICKKSLGYSPVYLSEIVRFQRSLVTASQNKNLSLSEIAWDSGYYDLSHMNRSYKKLVFTNVSSLLQQLGCR